MIPVNDLNESTNLIDLAQWQALNNPDRIAITYLPNGEGQGIDITSKELDLRARKLAVWIQKQAKAGDRIVLLFPSGLDMILGYYGCLYAGVISVLAMPPRPTASLDALQSIVDHSQAKFILTTSDFRAELDARIRQSQLDSLCWLATDQIPANIVPDDWQKPSIPPEAPVILLYTSGSTSAPKGVIYSHNTVKYHMSFANRYLNVHENSVTVSITPMYHIAGFEMPLIQSGIGIRCVVMPTQAFIERPIRLLNAITHYQGTFSIVFNFGLQLCIERTTQAEREKLDLRSWQTCMISGERVRTDLTRDFIHTFTPYGFQTQAMKPTYASTEGFEVSVNHPGESGFNLYSLDPTLLEQNRVLLVDQGSEKAQVHAGCGKSVPGKRIMIVDPETHIPCPPDRVGEIWVESNNISAGYWNQPEMTEASYQARLAGTNEGPFFRTGDMGFMADNDLVVTGRIKEMIILHGKNFYSQDIERTVDGCHPEIVRGGVAAFAVTVKNEERIAVVCEVKPDAAGETLDRIISAVRQAIAREQQQTVYSVTLAPAGAIPRTPSGKLFRLRCRTNLQNNQMEVIKQSITDDSSTHTRLEEDGYVAPKTPVERGLAGIWGGVLNKPGIGVMDNFFDLGGDSLLGTQIIAQVQEVFQVELSAQFLFKEPTIAGMARFILMMRNRVGQ